MDIAIDRDGFRITGTAPGETVRDLLDYVHIDPEMLLRRYREKLNGAGLSLRQRQQFEQELTTGLTGNTYLEK